MTEIRTCSCCGKAFKPNAKGFEGGRCRDRLSCMARTLGPSKAKTAAKRLGRTGAGNELRT